MVIDRIENAALYKGLGKRLAQAMDILKMNELRWLEVGRHELDGQKLFALVQHSPTKLREAGRWEAHRKYIDVQYVVEGAELMGYTNVSGLTEREAYDEAKDIAFYDPAPGSFLKVEAGMFAIFFPQDAHMPSLAVTTPEMVKKVVIKVALEP